MKEVLNKLYEELDYWCDQYKYANDVLHSVEESKRISENIVTLEKTIKLYK